MSIENDGPPNNVSYPKDGEHSKRIEKVKDDNGKVIGTIFIHEDGTGQVAPHKKKD